MADETSAFWTAVSRSLDLMAYQPARRPDIVVAQLEANGTSYYVLKQPHTHSYLRLAPQDFALWEQMDGQRSLRDLLLHSLLQLKALPITRLPRLVSELRANHFLCDEPTGVYLQLEAALVARAPSSRGRQLLHGIINTEFSLHGTDGFFTCLYRWFGWLCHLWVQLPLLLIVLLGGILFARLVGRETYTLFAGGTWSLLTLLLTNTLVIGIHELAHGLATKQFGRELHRAGFLIYWGMPAFFVDTRDTWLSPLRARLWVMWAGPYSGLVVGGLVGMVLTAVTLPPPLDTILYQIGFVAYFSVLVNLNPLLELDGYFMLMDWLDIPNLRPRALAFWRRDAWPRWRAHPTPRRFWAGLSSTERIFTIYGALTLVYSALALWLAFYFWQSRLAPLVADLWQRGAAWRVAVVAAAAALAMAGLYYVGQFLWAQVTRGLEWLARRDLLARPGVLALLLGVPLAALALTLTALTEATVVSTPILFLLSVAGLAGVARQLPGSRFQAVIWALAVAALMLAGTAVPALRPAAFVGVGLALLGASGMAWFSVRPTRLHAGDIGLMSAFLLGGLAYTGILQRLTPPPTTTWILLACVTLSLAALSPLLVNFARSRFALPWALLSGAVLMLPAASVWPALLPAAGMLWLYAALLYWLVGHLAQFAAQRPGEAQAVFSERQLLVNGFQRFTVALFASYEPIFGARPLAPARQAIADEGALSANEPILRISARCQRALLRVVDCLDDLAGTPFTQRAGQAAYDSLPWLQAETLGRYVLATTGWGAGLAQGFIRERKQRSALLRQAEVFAGLDAAQLEALTAAVTEWNGRAGQILAREGDPARRFFLVAAGEVEVLRDGVVTAVLEAGGCFGLGTLQGDGRYSATYRARTACRALVLPRAGLEPLWRVDAALAEQAAARARERALLHALPLFSELSPQQLTALALRLEQRQVPANEIIVTQGAARSHFFIVAAGQVEVLHDGERVGLLGSGEHFGEFALFADVPYAATYRSLTACELLLLDEPHFDELAAQSQALAHYAEQIGTGRLVATRRRGDATSVLA